MATKRSWIKSLPFIVAYVYDRIGQQRDAWNKGMVVQLPPLYSAYDWIPPRIGKVTQEAKDIAEVCKRATKASDHMHKEWSSTTKRNEDLSL